MSAKAEAYVSPGDKCANIMCANKPAEGKFAIVTIGEGYVVGGQRRLQLFLCSPCATAMMTEANA